MRLLIIGLLLGALSPAAAAQLASSPNAELQSFSWVGGGGGASSEFNYNVGAMSTLSSAEVTSTSFEAEYGLLGTYNPDPTIVPFPVLWGILPRDGINQGGTPVTLYGLNLSGVNLVEVGSSVVSGVAIPSGTIITGTTTQGSGSANLGAGQKTVKVTDPQDPQSIATLKNGWVYTPAITSSPTAYQGAKYVMTHYGPANGTYSTWLSLTPFTAPLPEGTLLIGPTFLLNIIPYMGYGPTGVSELVFDLPIDPALSGLTIYMQDLELVAVPPHQLTNRTQTTFF